MSENLTVGRHASGAARRLGAQTVYVLLGNLFTLAIGLPLQIYVSRVLGTVGIGVFGLIDGVISTVNGFLNFGLAETTVRFVPAHLERREYASVRRLIRFGITALLAVGVSAYVLELILLPQAVRLWPELAGQGHIVALLSLTLPLGLIMYFLQQGLRGFQEIRYMVLGSSVVQILTKAAATIAAFAAGLALEGYVIATVFAYVIGVLWLGRGLKRKLDELPAETQEGVAAPVREWRSYATICYVNGLFGAATSRLDRFILGAFVGTKAVGVLVVVHQIQDLPQVFNRMLLMVGAPMLAAAAGRNDVAELQHLYALMTDWVVKSSLPLTLFLFLYAKPVLGLFGPDFAANGLEPLLIFNAAAAFSLICGPIGTVAFMAKLEQASFRISILSTVVFTAVMLALVVPLGLTGVAVAVAVQTVFLNVSVMVVVRQRLGLRWWNRRFFGWFPPAAVSGGVGAAILYSGGGHGAVSLALTLIAMYAAFVAVLFLQGLNEDERDLLRHLADRLLGRQAT